MLCVSAERKGKTGWGNRWPNLFFSMAIKKRETERERERETKRGRNRKGITGGEAFPSA